MFQTHLKSLLRSAWESAVCRLCSAAAAGPESLNYSEHFVSAALFTFTSCSLPTLHLCLDGFSQQPRRIHRLLSVGSWMLLTHQSWPSVFLAAAVAAECKHTELNKSTTSARSSAGAQQQRQPGRFRFPCCLWRASTKTGSLYLTGWENIHQ